MARRRRMPTATDGRQTRAVLRRYAGDGGSLREVVYDNCGPSPHIERPAELLRRFCRGRATGLAGRNFIAFGASDADACAARG
ncbi:hypothetical protein Ato02nite_015750 [Paractinoplanes toevensis]|uniref:Uncharacterized protein n=1 Tax=Paractinoplanes toevensis TaxID=571911 RepID=A0A919T6V2_9ACTN|nr:hypothetical protein Ato02nite_015750 [Actinoplanes toevensis]